MQKNLTSVLVASFLCFPSISLGSDDNLLKAIEVATQGIKFQSERLKIISENVANEYTTGANPGEDPYKRKIIFAKNKYDKKLKTRVVKVQKYSEDKKTEFKKKYDPGHPAADLEGYVKYPNVNKEIEIMDAVEAKKTYEANLGVIELTKAMIYKTIGILE